MSLNFVRSVLNYLHLDLTKNLEYDRLTKAIMKQCIHPNSNCIDVGCHKGELLDVMLAHSPKGTHFAFEPLPHLFDQLKVKYKEKATVYPYALSDVTGTSTFQYVKNAPAYSGIQKRKYAMETPDIEQISVELKTLDGLIPPDVKIDFIKIDVEGGEFGVLKGGKQLLKKYKPVVIFESGLGASDYYGTKPGELFQFLSAEIGLQISTLKSFIKNKGPLTQTEFEAHFNNNTEYYFIAYARS
ncbi:MAG TPA: FkbM family methyltransferase [Bacteroidia bacterium]|jgi:FkbM family methyltransferase|nr:FkbM family methyltransferase [Bacteroidia bacterium]